MPFVTGTLGGNLFEFVGAIGVWILAERLHLSAVLCLVAFAMTIARTANVTTRPRVRIHSFAVWGTAVFLLNVLAFLLMGLQARSIVGEMTPDRLREAAWFAAVVVVTLIVVRMAWVVTFNRLASRLRWLRAEDKPASLRNGVLIGWCGMRGLVTLATAFALPADFPQRDLIVLTAFRGRAGDAGGPGPDARAARPPPEARRRGPGLRRNWPRRAPTSPRAALATLEGKTGRVADHWRNSFEAACSAASLRRSGRAGGKAPPRPRGDPSPAETARRAAQRTARRRGRLHDPAGGTRFRRGRADERERAADRGGVRAGAVRQASATATLLCGFVMRLESWLGIGSLRLARRRKPRIDRDPDFRPRPPRRDVAECRTRLQVARRRRSRHARPPRTRHNDRVAVCGLSHRISIRTP